MVEQQPQAIENNTSKEREDTHNSRTKAAFSLLDHFVKVYNNTETYIKRGLTLFGLGTILAGASFGVGQRLPHNEVTLPENSSNTPTSNLSSTSTPQPPVNPTPQPHHPQPQIIYVTPPPTQSITVANPEPTKTSTSVESKPEPVVTTPPSTPTNQEPKPVVTTPPSTPTNQAPEPVVAAPPNPLPVPEELSQVKQTVDSFEQVSGAIANIQQDLNPLFGEGDD
jgi:hypothetical protein